MAASALTKMRKETSGSVRPLFPFPLGMAETSCLGQLLSQHPRRTAHHDPQQAQECPASPFDHRRMLGSGYAVVMS
jgi:hypothetical protein